MEKYCECGIYYDGFKDVIKHFMNKYGSFLKMKGNDITSKNKYDQLESLYTALNQMIKSLPHKGNDCISFMKKCKNKHQDEISDVISKLEKLDDLSERIEEYHKKLLKEIPDELDDYSEEEEEECEVNKNKINNRNKMNENEDDIYEDVDVTETMKNDQKNIVIIKDLLEDAELKAIKEEEKKKIIKVKNELLDMWNNIEVELNRNDEQIDNIEEHVDKGLNKIKEGNDEELEKAAKSAVKRRRLAYQGGLAAALGAAGTVVPGIGNVIGLALGGLIGYGLYRYDKHRLKKVLKAKKKMRDERNNK